MARGNGADQASAPASRELFYGKKRIHAPERAGPISRLESLRQQAAELQTDLLSVDLSRTSFNLEATDRADHSALHLTRGSGGVVIQMLGADGATLIASFDPAELESLQQRPLMSVDISAGNDQVARLRVEMMTGHEVRWRLELEQAKSGAIHRVLLWLQNDEFQLLRRWLALKGGER